MKIAVIENQTLVRRGLLTELGLCFEHAEAGEAEDFRSFQRNYPDFIPDLMLLGNDRISTVQELDLVREARKWCPKANMIVLGENLNRRAISAYFNAGVKGCLSRHASVDQLHECFRLVTTGKRYLSSELLITLLTRDSQPGYRFNYANGEQSNLTERQREIAHYVARGMSIKWIANAMNVRQSTVSVVKSTVFKKLGVRDIAQLKEVLSLSLPDNRER